jgi:hypothetical protein
MSERSMRFNSHEWGARRSRVMSLDLCELRVSEKLSQYEIRLA